MNEAIKDMITKPGVYAITTNAHPEWYFLAEVEADGTVHQLTPDRVRDGVLAADGWAHDVIVTPVK